MCSSLMSCTLVPLTRWSIVLLCCEKSKSSSLTRSFLLLFGSESPVLVKYGFAWNFTNSSSSSVVGSSNGTVTAGDKGSWD